MLRRDVDRFKRELNNYRMCLNDCDFQVANVIEKRLIKMYSETEEKPVIKEPEPRVLWVE